MPVAPAPSDLTPPLEAALAALRQELETLGSVAVAYSGGADSALLADVAFEVLQDRMVAVTARSPSLDPDEGEAAARLACERGIPHVVVETHELEDPAYAANPPDRCYHCKKELFAVVGAHARAHGFDWVADGFNAEDASDYRPGARAAREARVVSPLARAGLTKAMIREISRARGLRTWDRPATPCLSSRIPYGQPVTPEKLARIGAAERALRELGFPVVRVRHHGEVARVEVPSDDLGRLTEPALRQAVVQAVRAAGFAYVALDLEGFRSGSLNEVLPLRPAPDPP